MSHHPFFSLFEDPAHWQVFASGQSEGRLSRCEGADGGCGLRLEYDFHGGGGFVVLRREVRFCLPGTFEIGFLVRGEGPENHFEFKVSDPGNTNVWRRQRENVELPANWTNVRMHERDLPFAWGPAGGGGPSEVGAVEFAIVAGSGGKGVLELASPVFEDQTLRSPRSITATSHKQGFPPEAVFADASLTGWQAAPGDASPRWEVDFGRPLRFGGMVITWPDALPRRKFTVEVSGDGNVWTGIHRSSSVLGKMSHISTPGLEARHLRITFADCGCAALCSVVLRPDAFSSTPNEFIHAVAADYPRGWFPRYWLREQSYWTPVGSPEGKRRALINEEGMVEVDEAGFSLEPFILTGGKHFTWADVETSVSLPKGGAPMPAVTWKSAAFSLEILPWVDGGDDKLTLHVTYRLTCHQPTGDTRLVVAVRPFQVNPPWQAFRNLGGRSPIHHITCGRRGLKVEGREILTTPRMDAAGAATFDENGIFPILNHQGVPAAQKVDDTSGLASAAMVWNLPGGGSILEVTVSSPYFHNAKTATAAARSRAQARWEKTLGRVKWQVPASAEPAIHAMRTAAGHILINRDGAAIQPGPRRYTRSWVRDCVIMGAALAKIGLPFALREFLTWYAPFQREDGFIPCVVDRDGVDWLVEHDSHGQFLWGVREVFREGCDRKFLLEMMPHVRKAADFLIVLRAGRLTGEYRSGEHAACFGLLPESASHEGYLAHHVHSYWDDFWGIRGLEAAAELAEMLGFSDDSRRWKSEAARFQDDLLTSINKVITDKGLNYIPGSVEWADFDPTATSNAISMLDFAGLLPEGPLQGMLDTYLDGFHRKHRGEMQWTNYTAYEIRIIGAFVRLGKRDTANELLDFFLSDRRPCEWNQWPEITWRDPRSPGHLGDVPHTWIAAEYLLAVASMIAEEREATDSLVLAAGMRWAWIADGDGFSVEDLPTRYGLLDFRIRAKDRNSILVEIGRSIDLPPGGLTVVPPLPAGMRITSVSCRRGNHSPDELTGESIVVDSLPFAAEVRLEPREGSV
ncbi:discoidin domain-containing protein [Luteolibacter yonseiensis]|uniref:Discoidin domain-containing protein n=1 Tax=Luteolibacter yonseiensis TaxID=1144680 RepID=A0A934R3W7_9BACT|nr:discoidin domain-containing protein [Luteolibacter yonseiensis]MBK1815957.1 discoidin domain-containing protein [Luteolibacter yonseiensis]